MGARMRACSSQGMVVPWMTSVSRACAPMKNTASERKRWSLIWRSSSTKSDSDSPTAPRKPDLLYA